MLKDFQPISLLASSSSRSRQKGHAGEQLERADRLAQGQSREGVGGNNGAGGVGHVVGVFLQKETGTHFQFVPYRGLAPATQDISPDRSTSCSTPRPILPQVRAGNIKVYAVASRPVCRRARPPTADEAGIRGFCMSDWRGLWAPKGTPEEVIAKLNAAVRSALADPAVRKRHAEPGGALPASSRRPRRWARSRRRRSSGGGRSSGRRTSGQQPNSRSRFWPPGRSSTSAARIRFTGLLTRLRIASRCMAGRVLLVGCWMLKALVSRGQEVLRVLRPPRIVIDAPSYTYLHSGVICLHALCDRLNRLGVSAAVTARVVDPRSNTPQISRWRFDWSLRFSTGRL